MSAGGNVINFARISWQFASGLGDINEQVGAFCAPSNQFSVENCANFVIDGHEGDNIEPLGQTVFEWRQNRKAIALGDLDDAAVLVG